MPCSAQLTSRNIKEGVVLSLDYPRQVVMNNNNDDLSGAGSDGNSVHGA